MLSTPLWGRPISLALEPPGVGLHCVTKVVDEKMLKEYKDGAVSGDVWSEYQENTLGKFVIFWISGFIF